MEYAFVFLSILANTAKGYCTKKISSVISSVQSAICIHTFRNIICCIIAGLLVAFRQDSTVFSMQWKEFILLFLSGISMALFLLSWTFAIKTDAYMLVSACSSASFIVPCLVGFFVLNERFTLFKLLSFVEIIIALLFLLRYNLHIKGRLTFHQLLLLALVLFSQGINQAMQKLYTFYIPEKGASEYTFYSFLFTSLALIMFRILFHASESDSVQRNIVRNNLGYILIMSLSLFFSSFFQTLAAARIEAIILYPMINALSLIASSLMASLCFKERMRKECLAGLFFVLCALICSKI